MFSASESQFEFIRNSFTIFSSSSANPLKNSFFNICFLLQRRQRRCGYVVCLASTIFIYLFYMINKHGKRQTFIFSACARTIFFLFRKKNKNFFALRAACVWPLSVKIFIKSKILGAPLYIIQSEPIGTHHRIASSRSVLMWQTMWVSWCARGHRKVHTTMLFTNIHSPYTNS